ncbi:MAG: cation-translocating P-type ATPase [Chloroflexota bacterium]|nr:cation-translocating P-type ATPase [Chloroflexota bacterium]
MIDQTEPRLWHNLSTSQVVQELGADLQRGLTSAEAQQRAARFGPNQLREGKVISPLALLAEQFTDFIVLVLIAAAIVSGFLQEWVNAIAIIAIVILNAILGFFQEYRAERALAALKQLAAPTAQVTREGKVRSIPSIDLVPGDLIHLRSGDLVPADARVIDAQILKVEEAALTGESSAVEKAAIDSLDIETAMADRVNMAHAGTVVVQGRARAVVTATGMQTQLGRIANLVEGIAEEETPLQTRLDQVGKYLVYASLVVVAIVFIFGVLRGDDPVKMFLVAVSLAVAAVPEGLAAVVTIALALGMRRMVKRNALIRKLPAVETLGAATIICTDKTGTLTENEMTVREVVLPDRSITVTGEGFTAQGEFRQDGKIIDPENDPPLRLALTIGAVCNSSELQRVSETHFHVVGDPTEGALLIAAEKARLGDALAEEYQFVAELPFDAMRKRMTVIAEHRAENREDVEQIAFVKGAPETVIPLCTHIQPNDRPLPFDPAARNKILETNARLAAQARRLLALAYRRLDNPESRSIETVEEGLVFVALVGMMDPPRPEAQAAVLQAQRAGISVAMITGDHLATAAAVAREVNIFASNGKGTLTGQEIDHLSNRQLEEYVGSVRVYARVSPEHKLRIVRALKARNEIVAMTGDGVNDAPALKEAQIGIAMGITGTDVAKEASDMVLLDDNFASIVSAVREGRAIFDNIRKFIHFVLSHNIGEVLAMLVATLIGWPLPRLPIQILWINLVTDSLPALALGVEKAEPGIMERPPRPVDERILPNRLLALMAFQGSIVAISTLAAFAIEYLTTNNVHRAQAVAFAASILAQNVQAFNVRSNRLSVFQLGVFTNRYLIGAFALVVVTLLGLLYIPPLQLIFQTVPLSLRDWALVGGLALLPLIVMEVAKFVWRARERR